MVTSQVSKTTSRTDGPGKVPSLEVIAASQFKRYKFLPSFNYISANSRSSLAAAPSLLNVPPDGPKTQPFASNPPPPGGILTTFKSTYIIDAF